MQAIPPSQTSITRLKPGKNLTTKGNREKPETHTKMVHPPRQGSLGQEAKMSDNQINRVDMDVNARIVRMAAAEETQKKPAASSTPAVQSVGAEQVANQAKAIPAAAGFMSNNILKFQVDDQTKQVTIMIVDKESGKVVKTIPSEALRDIPAGKLLQYSI
jgi:uncharacterized FlaG/YvyC family protein